MLWCLVYVKWKNFHHKQQNLYINIQRHTHTYKNIHILRKKDFYFKTLFRNIYEIIKENNIKTHFYTCTFLLLQKHNTFLHIYLYRDKNMYRFIYKICLYNDVSTYVYSISKLKSPICNFWVAFAKRPLTLIKFTIQRLIIVAYIYVDIHMYIFNPVV